MEPSRRTLTTCYVQRPSIVRRSPSSCSLVISASSNVWKMTSLRSRAPGACYWGDQDTYWPAITQSSAVYAFRTSASPVFQDVECGPADPPVVLHPNRALNERQGVGELPKDQIQVGDWQVCAWRPSSTPSACGRSCGGTPIPAGMDTKLSAGRSCGHEARLQRLSR